MPKTESEPTPGDLDQLYRNITEMMLKTPDEGVYTYTLHGNPEYAEISQAVTYLSFKFGTALDDTIQLSTSFITSKPEHGLNPEFLAPIFGLDSGPAYEDNAEFNLAHAIALGEDLNRSDLPSIVLAFHEDDAGNEVAVTLTTIDGIPPAYALLTIKNYLSSYMPPEFFRTGDGDPNESLTGYDPSYDIKEQLKNHQQTPRRTKEILELANSNYDSFRYHLLKGSDCEAEITLDVIAGIYVEFDKSLTVYHPYVFGCDSQTKKQLYEAIYNINQPNLPPDPENPDHDLYILRKNERNFARSGKPICALIIGHDDNSPDKEQYILMATVNGLSAQNALKALADSVKPELDLYNRFSN